MRASETSVILFLSLVPFSRDLTLIIITACFNSMRSVTETVALPTALAFSKPSSTSMMSVLDDVHTRWLRYDLSASTEASAV